MTTSTTPDHQAAAAQARLLADKAVSGSLQRKAAGCVVVVLAMSKTVAGARRLIPEIPLDDVRQAAGELLDQLTQGEIT
ncbi:MAG: hypothetical protein ABIS86_08255 [Streptosporangiaceae bacterium]